MSRRSEPVTEILPDIVEPGLDVVFCGTAVGPKSAARGAYYAGPGNRFYQTLHEIGLTAAQLEPEQCWDLPRSGIGLTDLAKKVSALDDGIEKSAWNVGRLTAMIEGCAPRAVAFNGKRAARECLGGYVDYGPLYRWIGESAVYVLPSTSGAARRFWNVKYWHQLAAFVRGERYFDPEAPACESCGKAEVIPVLYGYPSRELMEEAERGNVALGGCVILEDNPAWCCTACGHEFGSWQSEEG